MIAGWILVLLVLFLPFEPRRPTVEVFGVQVTLLEALAAAAMASLAALHPARLSLPRGPLLALWAYASAHILSAAVAPHHPAEAGRFALRMVAMALFATIVAALPPDVRRRGLSALAVVALPVAGLSIAEGLGVRAVDPLLDLFRDGPVYVAGVRRGTGGSEHPNLAGAFLMYGILAGAAQGGPWGWHAARTAVTAAGIAFTWSRAAVLAALAGLIVLAFVERRKTKGPRVAAAVLSLVVMVAWTSQGGVRPTPALNARYEVAKELHLQRGEARKVTVHITNSGTEAWAPRGRYKLSYHWLQARSTHVVDGPRSDMPDVVPPGGSVVVEAAVVAPREAGTSWLVWDLVQGDRGWFSGHGVLPGSTTLVVGSDGDAYRPAFHAGDIAWRPSRLELWSLALRLWKQRPLLGVGPDNFRRLYGPAAGRTFWDPRTYANHTLLEAAATTGVLGAVALLAAVGLALWRAGRRRDAVPLALMAGIAVHGLFDYVLAMTGHYLAFALVVGAASAADTE